jgi:hypothetical protein
MSEMDPDTDMTGSEATSDATTSRRTSLIAPRPGLTLPRLNSIVPVSIGPRPPVPARGIIPQLYIPGVSTVYLDNRPIGNYIICGLPYNMEKPPNEDNSVYHRTTISNQKLRYELSVIQGPARARACGSGQKCELSNSVVVDDH